MIINEDELLEDTIEGVSNYLDRPLTSSEIDSFVILEIAYILDKMFEAQSECIMDIATRIKKA